MWKLMAILNMTKKKPSKKRQAERNPVDCGQLQAMTLKISPTDRIKQLERQLERSENRSPVESSASRAAGLSDGIAMERREIAVLSQRLSESRERLNTMLLNHANELATLKELTAVAQPVG